MNDSGCGLNIKCLCPHPNFFAQLQEQLPQVCSLDKIEGIIYTQPFDAVHASIHVNRWRERGSKHSKRKIGSFSGVSELCLQVVPSLGDSRESTVLGSIITLMTLATLSVMLRLAGRQVSAAKFGIDDVFIVLALVSLLNSKNQPSIRSPRADLHDEVSRIW